MTLSPMASTAYASPPHALQACHGAGGDCPSAGRVRRWPAVCMGCPAGQLRPRGRAASSASSARPKRVRLGSTAPSHGRHSHFHAGRSFSAGVVHIK
jgi:hypothetical protein